MLLDFRLASFLATHIPLLQIFSLVSREKNDTYAYRDVVS